MAITFFEKMQQSFPPAGESRQLRDRQGRGLCYLGNITHQVNTSNVVVAEYNFDACSVELGFCECSETKTVVELIPIGEADREGRRRSADDWSYTLDGNDLALFADRGFTGHEYLPWFNLYNMNGRMYDPLVGRFLNVDPYVQDAGLTQSYNRYSYCLNNPLRYTDYSGYTWGIFKPFVKAGKWVWNVGLPAIDPMKAFVNFMDWINNSTPETRQKMSDLGIPDFGVGGTVNLDGNVNFNGSIYGHEVVNTANKDRSKAAVQAVNKELTQVTQDYGQAWHAASYPGIAITTTVSAEVSFMATAASAGVVAMPFALAGDTRQEPMDYSYVVYIKNNPTGMVYVGRTSGFGTPDQVVKRRDASHHMNSLGYGHAVVHSALMNVGSLQGYPALRGREQQVLDFYGGVGGTGNSIRAVSPYNPFGKIYWGVSNMYFGPLMPYSGY